MQQRGAVVTRRSPGAFRCLVCRSYVHGTEAGHCPRCGFVPPRALAITAATPRRARAMPALLLVIVGVAALLLGR